MDTQTHRILSSGRILFYGGDTTAVLEDSTLVGMSRVASGGGAQRISSVQRHS